ncbi:hypothetical protein AB0F46_41115 [Streptomyces sp. NPDC026665]|uniref:hypothetical protein n=1 Tax=Streptomyces sp. NPDC026665 TaxID=3154798 RepID=UPI0033C74181
MAAAILPVGPRRGGVRLPSHAGSRLFEQITSAHADLVEDVEVALQSRHTTRVPGQYTDPVSVSALIVSVATFAWTVYNDVRSCSAAVPSQAVLARAIRRELERSTSPTLQLDPAERDRIIAVAVDETLGAAPDEDPDQR